MPAQSINLLPHRDFNQGIIGRALHWSLIYGRYIIVSTEIIVLLAFIYRFSLDRTITDLNEEIDQKAAIVQANLPFEERFRNLQERVSLIGRYTASQSQILDVLNHLQTITPLGIRYNDLNFKTTQITLSAVANNTISLSVFLNQLKQSTLLTDIEVTQLSTKNTGSGETTFEIKAVISKSSN